MAPPDLRLARRLADDELVPGRAAGVLAGPDHERARCGQHAFPRTDRVLVELRGGAICEEAASDRRTDPRGTWGRDVAISVDSLAQAISIDRPAARGPRPEGTRRSRLPQSFRDRVAHSDRSGSQPSYHEIANVRRTRSRRPAVGTSLLIESPARSIGTYRNVRPAAWAGSVSGVEGPIGGGQRIRRCRRARLSIPDAYESSGVWGTDPQRACTSRIRPGVQPVPMGLRAG